YIDYPDFVLCNNCTNGSQIHSASKPEINPLYSVFHPGIKHIACEKAIHSIDISVIITFILSDLCENCEADSISKHDENQGSKTHTEITSIE
ncbi:13487_t:CDS:1, partial [Racocetra fulgida]